jgi:hypothetical protein
LIALSNVTRVCGDFGSGETTPEISTPLLFDIHRLAQTFGYVKFSPLESDFVLCYDLPNMVFLSLARQMVSRALRGKSGRRGINLSL